MITGKGWTGQKLLVSLETREEWEVSRRLGETDSDPGVGGFNLRVVLR